RGQVPWPDAHAGECVPDHRRRRRGTRLDQARPLRPDQVARGDLVMAGHPGVDLEHLVPERGHAVGGGAPSLAHGVIVPDGDETDPVSRWRWAGTPEWGRRASRISGAARSPASCGGRAFGPDPATVSAATCFAPHA